jgi:hypothetical protein
VSIFFISTITSVGALLSSPGATPPVKRLDPAHSPVFIGEAHSMCALILLDECSTPPSPRNSPPRGSMLLTWPNDEYVSYDSFDWNDPRALI